jgi:hypothetical protein
MKFCKVEKCNNKSRTQGYCQKHYDQIKYHGKILERTIRDPNNFLIREDFINIECYDIHGNITGYGIIDLEDLEQCKGLNGVLIKGIYLIT